LLVLGVFAGWITITASAPWLLNPAAFMYRHLRLSIVAFGVLFILYGWLLFRMRYLLDQPDTELAQLSFYDRLLNTTISTFFGVGVIWTAIGMETALMQALEGMDTQGGSMMETGAYGLLERLVNGGLLLALSTTVFGGFCGYLLRLLKIVLLGAKWDRFILKESGNG
jgi:heme A synthase